jgi:hypothetical protein
VTAGTGDCRRQGCHALHGIHYIALLRQESVAQIGGPLNVVSETFHHVGKGSHGLNAWIPRLLRDSIGECLVFQPGIFC